jgi:hypothetical protein
MSGVDWTQVDWDDLYPRLLSVAAGRLNRLSWRGKRFGPIPGAKTPKDIVHDAIVKTMTGQRVWNRKYSLFKHLVGVIYGEISNLVHRFHETDHLLAMRETGASWGKTVSALTPSL